MPQRNGQPTMEELAAQQQARGVGAEVTAVITAAATLAATKAAADAARTAAAVSPPVVVAAAAQRAIGLALEAIVGDFDRFLAERRESHADTLRVALVDEYPMVPLEVALDLIASELDRERRFAAGMRERLARDLRVALAIVDPEEREQAVLRIVEREQRYVLQREQAMEERVRKFAQAEAVKRRSPDGAYWRLHPDLDSCEACVSMAGKIWPWSVLNVYRPALHPNCACTLHSVEEALRMGWVRPEDFATPDDLPRDSLLESVAVVLGVDLDALGRGLRLLESQEGSWWQPRRDGGEGWRSWLGRMHARYGPPPESDTGSDTDAPPEPEPGPPAPPPEPTPEPTPPAPPLVPVTWEMALTEADALPFGSLDRRRAVVFGEHARRTFPAEGLDGHAARDLILAYLGLTVPERHMAPEGALRECVIGQAQKVGAPLPPEIVAPEGGGGE